MAFSLILLRDTLTTELPPGTPIGPVIFLRAGTEETSPGSGVYQATAVALTAANIEVDGLVVNDKITNANAQLIVNTRVKFTAVAFTSTPQIVVNRVYFVTSVTGDKVGIAETPGGTPIAFTATSGTATISDLLYRETLSIGGLTEPVDVPNIVRYEAPLGIDRPEWTPEAFVIGYSSSDPTGTLRVLMPNGQKGTIPGPPADVTYSGFAVLKGGLVTAGDTTGEKVAIVPQASVQTIRAGVVSTLLFELNFKPV